MYKLITVLTFFAIAHFSSAQYYTGYYVSNPQVHLFDHFKIKQEKTDSRLDGNLMIHAYEGKRELWSQEAHYVKDDKERLKLIENYQHGEEIVSVHVLKFVWDGDEWEYFLLGYIGDDRHRHFIVIEEIFSDVSETDMLEFHRFDWVKSHHLTTARGHK